MKKVRSAHPFAAVDQKKTRNLSKAHEMHDSLPVLTLSWSICSHFVAIHSLSVHRSRKSQNTKTSYSE